jgi:hypothetical protein
MNLNEARLAFLEELTEILVDLTDEGEESSPEDLAVLREAMADAVDIIAEALQLEVVSVDGDVLTLTADLGEVAIEE